MNAHTPIQSTIVDIEAALAFARLPVRRQLQEIIDRVNACDAFGWGDKRADEITDILEQVALEQARFEGFEGDDGDVTDRYLADTYTPRVAWGMGA